MQDEAALDSQIEKLLDRGKISQARRTLEGILRIMPNSVPAHFHLARVYRRTGDFKRALWHGKKTLKLSPKEANAFLNLALIYHLAGDRTRARVFYRKELKQDPFNAQTLWNLGQLYFEGHQWKKAAACLQRSIDLKFDHELEDTIWKLGLCYQKVRRVDEYISLFEDYLRIAPGAAWAASNLGRAYAHKGDFKHAVLWLKKAFRLSPSGKLEAELSETKAKLAATQSSR
jgi:tetratricopeptide (TPR) repeat protein